MPSLIVHGLVPATASASTSKVEGRREWRISELPLSFRDCTELCRGLDYSRRRRHHAGPQGHRTRERTARPRPPAPPSSSRSTPLLLVLLLILQPVPVPPPPPPLLLLLMLLMLLLAEVVR